VSCGTTFSDRSAIDAVVVHRFDGDRLEVVARVTNGSKVPITFVQHPDFWSISVLAADRTKDESFHISPFSFERATKKHLLTAQPGQSVEFSHAFHVRKPRPGVVDIIWGPRESSTAPYTRIWDSHLQATFQYRPDNSYFPKWSWTKRCNFVMVDIEVKSVFPWP
jgi:hypothetical protein